MKTIYKYTLEPSGFPSVQDIQMPDLSELLTVQVQLGRPQLWALVDPSRPLRTRKIEVFGTGEDIESDGVHRKYIGTFQLEGGGLVFHVFERL